MALKVRELWQPSPDPGNFGVSVAMQINITYDQSQSSLPAGFVTAINYVVALYDAMFTNNVTVNIDVGYGEVNGQSLGGDPGLSSNTPFAPSYSSVRNALIAENAPGANTLPTNPPVGAPPTLGTTQAEAKALGLIGNDGSIDGYVGFSNAANEFSYSINGVPPAGEIYFVGVVEHEFSHVMGRVSLLNFNNAYSVLDLFRYSGANARQFTANAPAYFSINSGAINLNNFQTGLIKIWPTGRPARETIHLTLLPSPAW
jgi:hypothetical protein